MDMLHHISLSRLEDKRETVSGKSCFCSGNSTSKLNVAFVMLIVFPLVILEHIYNCLVLYNLNCSIDCAILMQMMSLVQSLKLELTIFVTIAVVARLSIVYVLQSALQVI
ncbi:uncharacterized protein LOC120012369 isoform X1 [Tripterygium wilfordii]|uniref:uncharacterized protein LOC120012369 isoform X1 n=1 Tax=Tripterygium wilfordii TaxID=458696 RepID=UPI0018F85777|nr:uncharacterized protein LOC120012369 isoform X1 [Tripterygium wilfordii]